MIIVKILGLVDLVAAIVLILSLFGFSVPLQLIMFCAGLLFFKGLFVFTGDVLSIIDIFSCFVFLLSIFFTLPSIFIWIPAFLLLAKAMVSFVSF